MARRNKLLKFSELQEMPNVYQNPLQVDPNRLDGIEVVGKDGSKKLMQGKWHEHFGNDKPITLELACGRGEYSLALAAAYPDRNFIGLDIKGARLWKGATQALDRELNNVAFLRTRIEMVHHLFGANEIDEIWITFPDPFLRKSKANKRLTSPRFIAAYRQILRPNGLVHLKTDDDTLYEYTTEVWTEDPKIDIRYTNGDIYATELAYPELAHKTYYEYMHLDHGKSIKYIQATINNDHA